MYELSENEKIRLAAIVRDQHGKYLLLDKFANDAPSNDASIMAYR